MSETLVSVVMPCLNEEDAIGFCIQKIRAAFDDMGIDGEIIVCDNGSTDRSTEIAEMMSAKVIHQPLRGYGNAYIKGFSSAKGKYFVMGDSDDTYDFRLIPKFLEPLIKGDFDFVTGSRFLSEQGLENNPVLHRIVGNPLITFILNRLFGTKYTDVYCGFRAFTREAYELIEPVSPGMEFNLELAINAGLAKLRIQEVPICLAPRKGKSKLRTIRDGWRSLRMMLLYAPNKVFMYPGIFFLIIGAVTHIGLSLGLLKHEGRQFGFVTGILAMVFTVVGFKILSLGLHTKTYSWSRRFDRENLLLRRFYRFFTLEIGLMSGFVMITGGVLLFVYLILDRLRLNLLPSPHPEQFALAATLVILGFEIFFSSLFISSMSMRKR